MENITRRLAQLHQLIARHAHEYQRDPDSIGLLAVSKRHELAAITGVLAAGQCDFGENYVQEALVKITALAGTPACWHFIGPLQSNKTAAVAGHFSWAHTLDRDRIAQRLSAQRPAGMAPLNVCIQVNISGEASKSGVSLNELPAFAGRVAALPGLRLRGLMALPAPAGDFAAQRRPFRQLRDAFEQLQQQGLALDTLSMGTSNDMAAAIAEGATLVRIGTALFGPRPD